MHSLDSNSVLDLDACLSTSISSATNKLEGGSKATTTNLSKPLKEGSSAEGPGLKGGTFATIEASGIMPS